MSVCLFPGRLPDIQSRVYHLVVCLLLISKRVRAIVFEEENGSFDSYRRMRMKTYAEEENIMI